MTTSNETALKFAKSQGFDFVTWKCKWNGYDVFYAEYQGNETPIIGYPSVILADKEARFATTDEIFDFLQIHPVDLNNYDGEVLR